MAVIRRSGRPSPSAAMFKKHHDKAKAGSNLRKQITTLRAQLKKHGGHTAECAVHEYRKVGYGGIREPEHECDCNWAEIEKGL